MCTLCRVHGGPCCGVKAASACCSDAGALLQDFLRIHRILVSRSLGIACIPSHRILLVLADTLEGCYPSALARPTCCIVTFYNLLHSPVLFAGAAVDMSSTSGTTAKPADEPAEKKGELAGEALKEQLRIGNILLAIAIAPFIMQVCFSCMLCHLYFYAGLVSNGGLQLGRTRCLLSIHICFVVCSLPFAVPGFYSTGSHTVHAVTV